MKQTERVNVFVDGASRGNPGESACGVVVVAADGKPLLERGFYLGTMTNNKAEYEGLLRSLAHLETLGFPPARIHSDSELMVKQINGLYRVKNPGLKPLWRKAMDRIDKAGNIEVIHVRREKNETADRLANLAIDRGKDI